LEESLANAESYRRLNEQRVDPAIRDGLRRFLMASIPMQPPGYREGVNCLSETQYRDAFHETRFTSRKHACSMEHE
jgi:hypothetical protein